MSNLSEAYQSLEQLKKEETTLINKRSNIVKAYEFLLEYCQKNSILYTNISVELERLMVKRSEAIHFILFTLALYLLIFGGMGFILTTFLNFMNWGGLLGGGLASAAICTGKYISDVKKHNKDIKLLSNLKELLENNPNYMEISLIDLQRLLLKEENSISNEIDTKKSLVEEYEDVLNKINNELASNILDRRGIPAEVSLDSSMKVLEKRLQNK